METVILTIFLIVTVVMVAVILLQRSEGGGLGIGGGNAGGLMTSRGAGDLLSKTTKWLAVAFLSGALLLGWFANNRQTDRGLIERAVEQEEKEGGSQLPELPTIPEDG